MSDPVVLALQLTGAVAFGVPAVAITVIAGTYEDWRQSLSWHVSSLGLYFLALLCLSLALT